MALIKFTSLGKLVISSLFSNVTEPVGALPTRLEKNKFPLLNKSTPSLKNCRCSENVCSNGPRFSVKLSKDTWLKSGIKVASKVKFSVRPYLRSKPILKSVSTLPSNEVVSPKTKG